MTSEAYISMAGVTGATALALARIKGVGPLLLLSRCVDRLRAFCACSALAMAAALDEYRRMYPSCLAKVQREQ